MTAWIPSLITSGVVIIITVGSVIFSMRIQLAKLESKFDAKFESIDSKFQSIEKDLNRLETKIDNVNQELGTKIDRVSQNLFDHAKDLNIHSKSA